jgi:GAF domain-containing protein
MMISNSGTPEVAQLAETMDVMSRAVAEREDALQRALRVRQELYQLADALNRARTLDEVSTASFSAVQAVLGAPRAALLIRDSQGVMRFAASRGLSAGYQAAVEGHSPWTDEVRDPKPVIIADATVDTSLHDRLRGAVLAEGIRSMVFVPLVYADRLIGKFMVYHDEPHTFAAEEIGLAQTIASRVAASVDRQQAAEALTAAYATAQTARDEAEAARSRLAFLADASSLLASSMDYQTILKQLARLAVPRIADWSAVYTVGDDGTVRRLEIVHADPAAEQHVKTITDRRPPDPEALRAALGQSLQTGRTVVIEEITEDWLRQVASNEEMRALAREMGLRSLLMIPLAARGQSVGAIAFATTGARRFNLEEIALAEELARRASVAADNARLFQREHAAAQTLQQAFLPDAIPQVPGAELHAVYLLASAGLDVGGDWYDAFRLPGGRLAVSIGDVTGKGIEAAVTMGQVRQGIRTASDEVTPSAVLTRVARHLRFLPGRPWPARCTVCLIPGRGPSPMPALATRRRSSSSGTAASGYSTWAAHRWEPRRKAS